MSFVGSFTYWEVTELQAAFLLRAYNHRPLGAHSKAMTFPWQASRYLTDTLLQDKCVPIQLGPNFNLFDFAAKPSLNTESFLYTDSVYKNTA